MSTALAKKEETGIQNLSLDKLLKVDEAMVAQKKLVKDNPFTKITNTVTYDLAKRRRTNLLRGRTFYTGKEKGIASSIRIFRGKIKEKVTGIVDVSHPAELKQQSEIDKWEDGIAERRAEREEKDRLRRLAHTEAIGSFLDLWKTTIGKVEFKDILELNDIKVKVMAVTGEFEEFNSNFGLTKEGLIELADAHRDTLQLIEDKRIVAEEKAALKKEKEAQDAKDLKDAKEFAKVEAEKKRVRLLPDKERLIETFEGINTTAYEMFHQKEARALIQEFEKAFSKLKKDFVAKAKKL